MASSDGQAQECFHCGLPVPPGASYQVQIKGEPRDMCCTGCQAVAQAIVDGGLEDFYKHRTASSRKPEDLVPEALRQLDVYDQQALQQSFVEGEPGEEKSASLILEGITCAACVWLNERHVRALDGVLDFHINYSTHRARVRWDDTRLHLSDILRAITEIGYVAHPFDPGRQEQLLKKEKSAALRRLAIAGLGAMQVMMLAVPLYSGGETGIEPGMRNFMRWVSLLLTLVVVLYSARPFFVSAWRDLRRRRAGMDVPVSIAIGGAFLASVWSTITGGVDVYFDSVCMFAFFLLASKYLEMGARHRAGEAAEALVKLLPATARRVRDGQEQMIAVAELAPGDLVRVRPGETLPADGVLVEGVSSVDESLLTGESLPRPREAGDELVGGSVNVESPLLMRVDKVGEQTVVSAIVRLLDRAQAERPDVAALADRVAGWFVLGLLLLASGVALTWWNLDPTRAFAVTLSVLVVTCPCALSLATPTAVTAATGALTRLGLLTTRGRALESLARVTHIVLDKTGTLTKGNLQLVTIEVLRDGMDELHARRLAATLESASEHPVGKALQLAQEQLLPVQDLIARPGAGISGSIDGVSYRIGHQAFAEELSSAAPELPESDEGTTVVLADQEGPIACFLLADQLRSGAQEAIQGLHERGIEVEILSGDAQAVVDRVAAELNITQARGGLLPEDKLARVRELQARGGIVAMVGDGVNDAPVLAGANVSIAMGGGAQLAHASADMVMLSERIEVLAQGVDMARRTFRVIRQNLGWAVGYNLLAVPMAALGWVAPWMAAIGMSLSSLVVVTNALRLRK